MKNKTMKNDLFLIILFCFIRIEYITWIYYYFLCNDIQTLYNK